MAIEDEIKDVQQFVVNQLGVANGLDNSIADGQVTPAKLSTGAPEWNSGGAFFTKGGQNELNSGVVGDDFTYLDFHSTSASNPDYDARISKSSGVDGNFNIMNKGSGEFRLHQDDRLKFQATPTAASLLSNAYQDARISCYASDSTWMPSGIQYTANKHIFKNIGQDATSSIHMNMTDDGDAEMVIWSSDSNSEANLRISSYTPSVIFQDRSSGTDDFQIQADSNHLNFRTGDSVDGSDSQLPNVAARLTKDGAMSFGRAGFSAGNAEQGVVISQLGYIYLARSGTALQIHASFINNATVTPTTVGTITTNGSTTSYNTSSDYSLKEDIVDIEGSIERLKDLKPVNFKWKSDGTRVDGFIAHEAQEVVPEAVTGTKDAVYEDGNPQYQGIDQSKLVPLLTKALQEAVTKIEALEARVTALEA